jgi:macrolide-specific efflux system membrane fusion protein
MQVTLIALSTAFLLAGPQPATTDQFTVSDCLITLIEEIDLPAREAGQLIELRTARRNLDGSEFRDAQGNPQYVEVREGLYVMEGQVLGRIDDEMERKQKEVAQHKLTVAEKEATNRISVEYAEASYDVAKAEVEQSREANRRYPGTVPPAELNRKLLAQKQALLQIRQSEYELEIAALSVGVRRAEVELADLQIARRRILAPIDGIVVKRYVDPGEWVQPGEDVLRIVRMNRVRIEGLVDESQVSRVQLRQGQRVTVRLGPDRTPSVPGHVVYVSPMMVSGSRFEVWAEVDNVRIGPDASRPDGGIWLLSPGLKAEMTIHLK